MDSQIQLKTGGIQRKLIERASFSERFLAYFIDGMILSIPLGALFYTLKNVLHLPANDSSTRLLFRLINITVTLLYFAFYAYKHDGQTIGKKIRNIRVSDLQGNDLSLLHFLFREVVAKVIPIAISLPLVVGNYSGLWYLTYLFALTKNKRALHDIVSKTQVVQSQ